jgi:hypothetical protein
VIGTITTGRAVPQEILVYGSDDRQGTGEVTVVERDDE